jgi:hypothetical protein
MRSDIPSACTKSIFADLYLEILTKSAVRSPLMFGWEDKGGLVPVFFGDKCHQTSCRISCAVAKENQCVPVAVEQLRYLTTK